MWQTYRSTMWQLRPDNSLNRIVGRWKRNAIFTIQQKIIRKHGSWWWSKFISRNFAMTVYSQIISLSRISFIQVMRMWTRMSCGCIAINLITPATIKSTINVIERPRSQFNQFGRWQSLAEALSIFELTSAWTLRRSSFQSTTVSPEGWRPIHAMKSAVWLAFW